MGVQKETLRAMVRDYHGFELSDEELELIQPALDEYMTEMEKLRGLDLSNVMSGRLLRAMEGGQS
jgi:hypothetical protein